MTDSLQLARQLRGTPAKLRLRVDVGGEHAPGALDVHGVRYQRLEATADWEQPGPSQTIERPPPRKHARVPERDLLAEAGELSPV